MEKWLWQGLRGWRAKNETLTAVSVVLFDIISGRTLVFLTMMAAYLYRSLRIDKRAHFGRNDPRVQAFLTSEGLKLLGNIERHLLDDTSGTYRLLFSANFNVAQIAKKIKPRNISTVKSL